MVHQAIDHVPSDGAVRILATAVAPKVKHGPSGKKAAADGKSQKEAAEHEEVLDIEEQRTGRPRHKGTYEQHGQPGDAAHGNGAADVDKALDEHVPHHKRHHRDKDVLKAK